MLRLAVSLAIAGHLTAATGAVEPTGSPHPMLIGGKLVQAQGMRTQYVINPATGQPFTTVPDASKQDADRAVMGR